MQRPFELSGNFVGLTDRHEEFRLPTGRRDEFANCGTRDPPNLVVAPREMFVFNFLIDTLKVKARIFLDLCLANYRSKVRIGSRRATLFTAIRRL